MNITFYKLTLENFKNHKSLTIEFDDILHINARNGAGKSSIGDSISWLFYGTDTTGTKLEPKPIDNQDAETKVELLLVVNGKQILLGRTQKKTVKYYINEVPEKATKFNETVESLFDKTLFLSNFNPSYFFTLNWQDQRKFLLSYISEPTNKEVLAKLNKVQLDALTEPLKKNSLDDLEKIHRERFRTRDKELDRANERVLTLKEQLEKESTGPINVEDIEKKIVDFNIQRTDIEEDIRIRNEGNVQRGHIESQITFVKGQIDGQKVILNNIKNEGLQEHCRTCGQALDEVAIQKVKEDRQQRFNKELKKGKELSTKFKELQSQLSELPAPVEVDRSELTKLDEQVRQLQMKLDASSRIERLTNEIKAAEESAKQIRVERNDSQSIVDAIKEFRTKRSEIMVEKVDGLFTNISVKLFETLKNGEEKATFELEMDGKPYSKLSTAEKIKCGLELIEVLSKQSGLITPTFVDNAESILHFAKPSGQLIVARVVDCDFEIKQVSLKEDSNA